MTNKKATKRALLTSVLAIVMCLVMLIGSTFAWFTDTASTGVNKIESGKLKVGLEYEKSAGVWDDAEGQMLSFKDVNGNSNILWEPGATFNLEPVRVVNKGNLALKYKVEITGIKTNVEAVPGAPDLNEVIEWTIDYGTADNQVKGENNEVLPGEYFLLPSGATSQNITITGTMSKDAGNAYQGLTIDGVAITVLATQYTYENDSTGPNYDADAKYPEVSADDLQDTLAGLEDNAVISVTGTVENALTISKPVTIHNLTATAPVTITSNGVTLNAANITTASTALKVDSGVTDVTITNSVITAATGSKNSHTAVSLPVSGKVVFTGNTVTNDYNGVEFGQKEAELLGNGSVIANNTFSNIGNNAISIYRVADGASITIENNVFDHVSNAIRLSNYPTSTSATFNIKNNTVDIVNSWENVFVLLEDTGSNDFTKYTLSFSGNTFNGSVVNNFKVYSDATIGFVDNNNPTVK